MARQRTPAHQAAEDNEAASAAPPPAAARTSTSPGSMQSDFIKVTAPVNGDQEYIPAANIRLITVFDDDARKATVENMRNSNYQNVPEPEHLGIEVQFKEAVAGKTKLLAREKLADLGNLPLLHIGNGRYILNSSIGTISDYTDKDRERMERRNEERGQTPQREPQDWKSKIQLLPSGMVLSTMSAETLIRNRARGPSGPAAKPF